MAQNGFVLIHGSWHDHHAWDAVVPRLEDEGFSGIALDLPGAGTEAKRPACYDRRPIDRVAFATAPSPNADVTQDERTEAAIKAVRWVNAKTGGKAVVVGHSLGGLTLTQVAEAIPDELSAAVYLAAYMLPPGMPAAEMMRSPSMTSSISASLLMADPMRVGARRIDPKSEDPAYRVRAKETFYGDLTEAQFEEALRRLHPDEPLQVTGVPSPMTPQRFGKVARHYIECAEDRAIPLAAQNQMVLQTDAAIGGRTTVHGMTTSHSPFHSNPDLLSQILIGIANA